jgi:hypothetical protein
MAIKNDHMLIGRRQPQLGHRARPSLVTTASLVETPGVVLATAEAARDRHARRHAGSLLTTC